jgi:non-specific serine/threonine protein kinase
VAQQQLSGDRQFGRATNEWSRLSREAGAGRRQELARHALGPDVAAATWTAGHALSVEEAIAEALHADVHAVPRAEMAGGLSPREREVAVLVAHGLTNRDIAEKLVVSERTAENHVQRVLNRLGLRSRAQVAAWAVRNGLAEEA